MEWYVNGYGEEMDKDKFIGLQSLIKYNKGEYKSDKQGKFIQKAWTILEDNLRDTHWVAKWVGIKEGIKYVDVEGYTEFSHGRGKGHRRIQYLYEIDNVGVLKRYRIRFKYDGEGGSEIKKVEQDYERETPFQPIAKPKQKKMVESVSEYLGNLDERIPFEGTCVFVKDFENQWGVSYINKFVDAQGNVFVYFGSKCFDRGTKYRFNAKVKEHEEYNGEKQTKVQRPTKVEELS